MNMSKKEWVLGDINKSLRFVSPILGLDMEGNRTNKFYKDFFQNPNKPELNNFLNCFIGDDVVNIEDKILLLYKFSGDREFLKFEDQIQEHPLYDGTYDPDKTHVMFVFNIPDKAKADFELIKEGKYSQISKWYLDLCISFFEHEDAVTEGRSTVYNIVTKQEKVYLALEKEFSIKIPRTSEACSKMYREEEYYQEKYLVRSALKGI
jgi:hypothetical protein